MPDILFWSGWGLMILAILISYVPKIERWHSPGFTVGLAIITVSIVIQDRVDGWRYVAALVIMSLLTAGAAVAWGVDSYLDRNDTECAECAGGEGKDGSEDVLEGQADGLVPEGAEGGAE